MVNTEEGGRNRILRREPNCGGRKEVWGAREGGKKRVFNFDEKERSPCSLLLVHSISTHLMREVHANR